MTMFLSILLIAFCTVMTGCGDSDSQNETAEDDFVPDAYGDFRGNMDVEGTGISWETVNGTISITISAPTTGWIAFGLEPSAAMMNADIVIGYVKDGEVFLRDDWGDSYTGHTADEDLGGSNDITVISGRESDGTTEIAFSRTLAADDEFDRTIRPGETMKVMLAFGSDDADDFSSFHVWAKTVDVYFGYDNE